MARTKSKNGRELIVGDIVAYQHSNILYQVIAVLQRTRQPIGIAGVGSSSVLLHCAASDLTYLPVLDENPDVAMQACQQFIHQGGNIVVVDGQVYVLDKTLNLKMALQSLEAAFFSQARELQRVLQLERERLTRLTKNHVEMPELSLEQLQQGIRVYQTKENLGFILPIRYAPKFIHDLDDPTIWWEISSENQQVLAQDYLLEVCFARGCFTRCILCDSNYQRFHHYHSLEIGRSPADCIGDVPRPLEPTVEEVISFRDRLQEALTVIGFDLSLRAPEGLPRHRDLLSTATKCQTPVWGEEEEEEEDREVEDYFDHNPLLAIADSRASQGGQWQWTTTTT